MYNFGSIKFVVSEKSFYWFWVLC